MWGFLISSQSLYYNPCIHLELSFLVRWTLVCTLCSMICRLWKMVTLLKDRVGFQILSHYLSFLVMKMSHHILRFLFNNPILCGPITFYILVAFCIILSKICMHCRVHYGMRYLLLFVSHLTLKTVFGVTLSGMIFL